MKKMKFRGPLVAGLVVGAVSLSVASAAVGSSVEAYLRPDIRLEMNGKVQTLRDKNGNEICPIVYNGSTYLPVRAVGELLDQEIVWDSRSQTVTMGESKGSAPASLTYAALTARADHLEREYKELLDRRDAAAPTGSLSQNWNLWGKLEDDRKELQEELWELRVDVTQAAALTETQLKELNDRLNSLEDKLELMSAELLERYGIDKDFLYQDLREEAAKLTRDQNELKTLVDAAEKADSKESWRLANEKAQEKLKALKENAAQMKLATLDALRRGVITSEQYTALDMAVKQVEQGCKDEDKRLEKAGAKWGSEPVLPQEDWKDQDVEFYLTQLSELDSQVKKLVDACKAWNADDIKGGMALLAQLDALDDQLDALEDAIEDSAKLSLKARWELLRELDKTEDALDQADNLLERLGLDDDVLEPDKDKDDDDDDRDDHDDDDDDRDDHDDDDDDHDDHDDDDDDDEDDD